MTGLQLLDEVSWRGQVVTGDRSLGLLAVLASAAGRAVGEADLVSAIWGLDDRPGQPAKALQVVVSRTRTQTDRDAVVRVERGYRLGVPAADVDASRLAAAVREAEHAERSGDLLAARGHARTALALAVASAGDEAPALEELRAGARALRATATAVAGRAASTLGDHAEALGLLGALADPDETTLAALLRSEAAVHGAPFALTRYEAHRLRVRDRLGVDPGPVLQAVHGELLAADNPVRRGLLFATTSLVGRDDDVRALRALVRESRVTSILGPGGLGKTRLAHLLGRDAEQPVVHVVELVGVAADDDVVGEVGSALGVRDSVSGRRVLSAEQRTDVRARIAQQLDQAPTLLILDNCEHVVAAVADLVAFLVATAPRLRVVTTTRAPLAIAAERVFALDQLSDDAAADLFVQRATAARPGALLDDAAVRRVVRRLDGLPLAVELAAAKVRAMSVDDIDRRLDDRFALLRGNDASAPDRHRTLMAVIDWSWNLLGGPERTALARLSLFHDGFALEAAEAVLGPEALAAVESLVGQSLLTVRESAAPGGGAHLRYRMLETVREFGHRRLGDDAAPARRAVRSWAVELCDTALAGLHGPRQVEVVRGLGAEDNNLADVLRDALAEPDPAAVVVLVAALGGVWTIKGEHPRIIVMTEAVEAALEGWTPPDDLVEHTARAAGVMVLNTAVTELAQPRTCLALLDRYGEQVHDPSTRALHRVLNAYDDPEVLAALADSPDRHTAMLALSWTSHSLENAGDPEGAIAAGSRALGLWSASDGVWTHGLLHTQLAGLHAQLGHTAEASRLAAAGLDAVDALEAHDDATQLRAVLASAAIIEGRLDDAGRTLERIARQPRTGVWDGQVVLLSTRAELQLARGDVEGGLLLYSRCVEAARALRFPGLELDHGLEPWTLYAESAALTAHARYAAADPRGQVLRVHLAAKVVGAVHHARVDFPLVGCVLLALGVSDLRRGRTGSGVALLALAERFGYSRYAPSMAWGWVLEEAERLAPGALPAAVASYAARRGVDVLPDARRVVTTWTPG